MIIGVISDTHIPTRAKKLPPQLISQLKKVDLIIHAGDFVEIEILKMLEEINKVEAVFGNMDEEAIKLKLPGRKIIEVEEVKIAIVHGCDIPWDLRRRVPCNFCKGTIDCMVFGHTHLARNEEIGRRLYFNPGSPTDQIFATANTFGIIEVSGKKIKGKIIEL
jgi:uncharacterized protein